MSNSVLVIGESGTGKSTSIRTLPPEETFVLNIVDKPLPFKGSRKKYVKLSEDGSTGNYYATDNHSSILRVLSLINIKRPEIKYLVIDDFGYSISNDFFRKALIKGYDKFSELAKNAFEILDKVMTLRDDLFCFIMMHTEVDAQGQSKPKTVGKMIDQYAVIEGKFTYVMHTLVNDGEYKFVTNNDNARMAKSPMGLFDLKIDNDLKFISDKIEQYLNEDIND